MGQKKFPPPRFRLLHLSSCESLVSKVLFVEGGNKIILRACVGIVLLLEGHLHLNLSIGRNQSRQQRVCNSRNNLPSARYHHCACLFLPFMRSSETDYFRRTSPRIIKACQIKSKNFLYALDQHQPMNNIIYE